MILTLIIALPITILVWIPLLVRMIGIIAFAAIASTFTKGNLEGVRQGLEEAIKLPVLVVQQTYTAIFPKTPSNDVTPEENSKDWNKFFLEVFFTLIFWVLTLFLVLQFSPLKSDTLFSKLFSQGAKTKNTMATLEFNNAAFIELTVYNRGGIFTNNEQAIFKVTLNSLHYDIPAGFSELNLSFCLISEKAYSFNNFYSWYTESSERNSIRWTFAREEPLKFLPGECKTLSLHTNDSPYITALLDQGRLGTLHFSFNDRSSFGSLDLLSLEEKGYIKRIAPQGVENGDVVN